MSVPSIGTLSRCLWCAETEWGLKPRALALLWIAGDQVLESSTLPSRVFLSSKLEVGGGGRNWTQALQHGIWRSAPVGHMPSQRMSLGVGRDKSSSNKSTTVRGRSQAWSATIGSSLLPEFSFPCLQLQCLFSAHGVLTIRSLGFFFLLKIITWILAINLDHL